MTKRERYLAYLGSAEWAAVRRAFFSVNEKRCSVCRGGQRLQLHHTTYRHVFNEMDHLEDLVALCGVHHEIVHGLRPLPVVVAATGGQRQRQHGKRLRALQVAERYSPFAVSPGYVSPASVRRGASRSAGMNDRMHEAQVQARKREGKHA